MSYTSYPLNRSKKMAHAIKVIPDLFLYWPQDEPSGTTMFNRAPLASDLSNGLIISGVTVGQSGLLGRSYSFSGASGSVELLSNTINLKSSTALSIGALVNNTGVAAERTIYQEDRAGNTTAPRVYFSLTSGHKLRMLIRTAFSDAGEADVTSTPVVPSGWSLVIGTVDIPTETFILYINGVSVAFTGGTTMTNNSITAANPDDVPLIGAKYAGGTHTNQTSRFAGGMQHLFIVKRVLTAAEVFSLAQRARLA